MLRRAPGLALSLAGGRTIRILLTCSGVPQAATAVLARAPAAAEADDPRDSAPAVPSRHERQQRSAPLTPISVTAIHRNWNRVVMLCQG